MQPCAIVICISLTLTSHARRIDLKTAECLKTSFYQRNPDDFVCKDLGLCYSYYCRKIARDCSKCKDSYSRLKSTLQIPGCSSKNITRQEIKPDSIEDSWKGWDFLDDDSSKLAPPLVKIQSGELFCSGIVAAVPNKGSFTTVVVTTAGCVIDFDVKCKVASSNLSTLLSNDVNKCFRNPKSKLLKVYKGFRSYQVWVHYKGNKVPFSLNRKSILVPREFMECRDCRYDIAVLRLTGKNTLLLNLTSVVPYLLHPSTKSSLVNKRAVVDLRRGNSPLAKPLFSNHIVRHRGVTTCVQKFRLGVEFPINREEEKEKLENLIAGSPVIVLPENRSVLAYPYRVSAIVTAILSRKSYFYEENNGTNKQEEENTATKKKRVLRERESDVSSSSKRQIVQVSAVRITNTLLQKISKWLKTKWKGCFEPGQVLHPRIDCFNAIESKYDNKTLCLCARGWRNERNNCKEANKHMMSGCNWIPSTRSVTCDKIPNSAVLMFPMQKNKNVENVVFPGNTLNLTIIASGIKSGPELCEILRHLTSLKILILDHNHVNMLKLKTLGNGRKLQEISLRFNNLSKLHSDSLRKNRRLETIIFSYNEIALITKSTFRKQKLLRRLDLSHNKIRKISKRAFRQNAQLQEVDLSFNNITSIDKSLFANNPNLIKVSLNNNHIEIISKKLFANCVKLTSINLGENELTFIPRDMFRFNARLKELILNGNSIATLPSNLLDHQTSLNKVVMHDNPLLPDEITSTSYTTPSSIIRLKKLLRRFETA